MEGIEKLSDREKKRTFGQLVKYMSKILKADKTHMFEDFLEDRNTLIHRLTGNFQAKLDTHEGLEMADELALDTMRTACINIATFFRGVKVLAERLQQMSARHGHDLEISGLIDDIDELFRHSVHPVIDPGLEKVFEGVGFNW